MQRRFTFWSFLFCLLLAVGLVACEEEIPDSDVADVELEIEIVRADSLMWECARALQENDSLDPFEAYLTYLKPEREFFYQLLGIDQLLRRNPMFQGRKMEEEDIDSLLAYELVPKLAYEDMYGLLDTIRTVFPYGNSLASLIAPPLKRMSLAFTDLEFPAFRTHVTGYVPDGDWRTADQVVPMPKYVSFGLHYFLGKNFRFYPPNIAKFQRRRCNPEYIPVQLMAEVAEGMLSQPDPKVQPRLIDKMVRSGIKQAFLKEMLPYTADSVRLLYTTAQMDWVDVYEDRIYKELISHLYKTDFILHRDYLSDKPYTTQLSMESAPRIGEYCGWKIVEAYREKHPQVGIEELMATEDYESIFKAARYKP